MEPTACWFSCRRVERHHAVSMLTSLLDVSPSRHKLQTTPLPPPSLGYHNNTLDQVIWHTIVRHSPTSTYMTNFIPNSNRNNFLQTDVRRPKGAITSKIKHAIKLKTIPVRLAQLLQPSLAFCFSLQPMTAHPHWTVRHHLLRKFIT